MTLQDLSHQEAEPCLGKDPAQGLGLRQWDQEASLVGISGRTGVSRRD